MKTFSELLEKSRMNSINCHRFKLTFRRISTVSTCTTLHKIRAFRRSTPSCLQKTEGSLQKENNTIPPVKGGDSQVSWGCIAAFGTACHETVHSIMKSHERFPPIFVAQCCTQCQKAWCPSKIMVLQKNNNSKHTSKSTNIWFLSAPPSHSQYFCYSNAN